jgi:hypothetical protein
MSGQPVDYSFNQALLDGDAMVVPKGSPNNIGRSASSPI